MQARQVFLAELAEPVSFADWLPARASGTACMAEPGGIPPTLARSCVLVGPEGGWSAGELDLARDLGVPSMGLSDNVLRVETAAVVAATLLTGLRAGLVRGATDA